MNTLELDVCRVAEGFSTKDLPKESHRSWLTDFLNACLEASKQSLSSSSSEERHHGQLKLIESGRPTRGDIFGPNPTNLDIAGGHQLLNRDHPLWWRPPIHMRSSTLEIPVEVNDTLLDVLSQAGTYSQCLNHARSLRQFALVLG